MTPTRRDVRSTAGGVAVSAPLAGLRERPTSESSSPSDLATRFAMSDLNNRTIADLLSRYLHDRRLDRRGKSD